MQGWVCLALLIASGLTQTARAATSGVRVYWVDVEGGAATLMVTPAGESVLIDTGNPGGRDAARIHKTATERAGLKQIDHLITTHFHIDHFGGAADLAKLMPIINVYDNGIPEKDPDNNPQSDRFLASIKPYREMKAARRTVLNPGDFIPLKAVAGNSNPALSLKCLATRQARAAADKTKSAPANPLCADTRPKDKDTSDNANSTVFLLEYGHFQLFVGGDLTWNTEADLVCPVNLVGVVDVFQVDHHGLDVSNNPVLVRSLAPTVSIMSNGTRKGCGAATFSTLKGTPSIQAMYQIHRNLREDSHNNTDPALIANLEEKYQANHIELIVEPDARNYSVAIPATGHKRTFRTQ